MQELKVESITISPDSIQSMIRALNEQIRKHTEIKKRLEEILQLQGGRFSPRAAAKAGARPTGGRGRGRPPRGEKTLRETILDVLQKYKGPLKPVELRDKVLEAGYITTATAQSFYTAVFNTARKEPGVAKTAAGFSLKAGDTNSGGKRKTTKRGAKKAKRKTRSK